MTFEIYVTDTTGTQLEFKSQTDDGDQTLVQVEDNPKNSLSKSKLFKSWTNWTLSRLKSLLAFKYIVLKTRAKLRRRDETLLGGGG